MNAYIVDAVRIPIGRRKGVYADTRSEELLAHVLRGITAKSGVSPKLVEDVIVGCVTQNQEQ
ncbi:MAG TPA: steroid 3-ketoacyl-CoA thiolase, partial [Ureibacillus sp.]|nr:steroid 3-ketoacyl-CoA thiolase [Ureibacillus sp.]